MNKFAAQITRTRDGKRIYVGIYSVTHQNVKQGKCSGFTECIVKVSGSVHWHGIAYHAHQGRKFEIDDIPVHELIDVIATEEESKTFMDEAWPDTMSPTG